MYLLLAFLLLLHVATSGAQTTGVTTGAEPYPVDRDLCLLTGKPPTKSDYNFRMCHFYEDNACCYTGHDQDILFHFNNMVDLGDNCQYRKRTKAPELHQWYCLGCHPDQPKFVDPTQSITYVCDDFAERLWTLLNGTYYPECALMVWQRDCEGGWDECGDDVVVPTVEYDTVEEFLNVAIPPAIYEMVDMEYRVVSKEEAAALGADCFNAASNGIVQWALVVMALGVVGWFRN